MAEGQGREAPGPRAPDIVRDPMTELPAIPPPPQPGEAWKLPGFDTMLGLEITHLGDDEAHAHVVVRDELLQPAGLVHGGVYAAMAESLCSAATWFAVAA